MTFGEVCAGVGGISLGFDQAGFRSIWHAESDPRCQSVLKRHWPHALLFDDMTNLPPDLEAPTVLAGGTPCTGFSVAGLRKSLNDERSNLALEFCRIADRLNPEFIVWENVPGVLSVRDNAFGCLLAALATETAIWKESGAFKSRGEAEDYWLAHRHAAPYGGTIEPLEISLR